MKISNHKSQEPKKSQITISKKENPNHKLQIPKKSQNTNSKSQFNSQFSIGTWSLDFVFGAWVLVLVFFFGSWSLVFCIFYLDLGIWVLELLVH
jgi:hypothetical protein